MALVSFGLFRKNLGNLQELFEQMAHRHPVAKNSRTAMFLGLVLGCFPLYQRQSGTFDPGQFEKKKRKTCERNQFKRQLHGKKWVYYT